MTAFNSTPSQGDFPRGATDREYKKFIESPPGSGQVAVAVASRESATTSTDQLLKEVLLELRLLRKGLGVVWDSSELLEGLPTDLES